MRRTSVWAEVDLRAYAHNLSQLRAVTRPEAGIMAVVKAHAYGHGSVEVSRQAIRSGAQWLGVARVEEALPLREAGLEAPILILGHTPPHMAETLIENRLTQTVYSLSTGSELSQRAQALGGKIPVHIKVDTGMGRLGLLTHDPTPGASSKPLAGSLEEVESLARLKGLDTEGTFTHFATSDWLEPSQAHRQLDRFLSFLEILGQRGIEFRCRHAANSGAVMRMPSSHLDLVRPGIATYGLYPCDGIDDGSMDLRPVMQLKSRIVHLQEVPSGTAISYGGTYRTAHRTIIATVPAGYADGVNLLLSSRGHMLVGGQRVPIAGRVCMDFTMLDLGLEADVSVDDEVVIFGQQQDSCLPVEEVADDLGTIPYEIVAGIGNRVPRVFIR